MQTISVIIIYYLFLSIEKTNAKSATINEDNLFDLENRKTAGKSTSRQQVPIDEDYPVYDIYSLAIMPKSLTERNRRSIFEQEMMNESNEQTARNINVNILNNLPFAELIRSYRGIPEPSRDFERASSGRRFNRF